MSHLSFEFFPPKKTEDHPLFFETVEQLKAFNPDFMSVTYGALGSNQEKTLGLVQKIQNDYAVPAMAHFTCVGLSKEKIDQFVGQLEAADVSRILALRGDIPQGVERSSVFSEFTKAADLVSHLKEHHPQMTVAVAGYPEGHPEAPSLDLDLKHLKAKVDCGAEMVITQMFFDNQDYWNFCEKAQAIGINVPIIPGIMPVTNYKMIERITQMCKIKIPNHFRDLFGCEDRSREDLLKSALEITAKQCEDLLKHGAAGLHFYTMNKCTVVKDVCIELSLVGQQKA